MGMRLEAEAIDRVLSGIPLFNGLEPECLEKLVAHCRMLTYKRGETIFRKGERAEGFYYVFDGKVKLYFVSERGGEKVIEVLSPGMTFGEAVVFIDEPYPAFAEALQPSNLLFVQRDALLDSIREHEPMALRLLAGLSRRLHRLVASMEAVCMLSSRERVIGFLLNELQHEERGVIELPSTKAVVASTLNLTPETFSRILHALEKEEIIQIRGRRIQVLAVHRLREYAAC